MREHDERPLAWKLIEIRAELTRSETVTEAAAALTLADLETCRAIETEFNFHPGPTSGIRDRLAQDFIRRRNSEQRQDTRRVSPEVVQRWVAATVGEWLPGYTDYDPGLGGQYRITAQTDGSFEVTTPDRYDPRRFRILLTVEEVD